MGRKRNQGKARRAAKAKAIEAADDRGNNNQTMNSSEQSLSAAAQMRQLHVSEIKCSHGHEFDPSVPSDHFPIQFVKAFQKSFFEAIRYGVQPLEGLSHAKNATLVQFADMWNDSAKMEMAMSFCLYAGTNAIIEGNGYFARDLATFTRFFEQYIATVLLQTHALISMPKIDETYHADEHTLVKFFRHRIPCSCLDGKYAEVKHITKLGCCWNPQCSIPYGEVERSKTKYCSRCRCVSYCSRECQEAHWTNHEPDCDDFVAMIAKFEAKRQE